MTSPATPPWAGCARRSASRTPWPDRRASWGITMARQDRTSNVRRWRREEAGLAPDIVLIEDDAALSDMIQFVLRSAGLSFRAYPSGEAGLEALLGFRTEGRRPLVLLD